jgi:exonuclease I
MLGVRRGGNCIMNVPYAQLSTTLQNLLRQGAKIIDVYCLNHNLSPILPSNLSHKKEQRSLVLHKNTCSRSPKNCRKKPKIRSRFLTRFSQHKRFLSRKNKNS